MSGFLRWAHARTHACPAHVRSHTLLLASPPCVLRAAKLYPHRQMYEWLVYGNGARTQAGWPATAGGLRLRAVACCPAREAGQRSAQPQRQAHLPPHHLRPLPLRADSKHKQADAAFFQRREFCFTMDGDIFVRYQSFKVGGRRV